MSWGETRWGESKWGDSDFGEVSIIRALPATYLEDDEERGDSRLIHYLQAAKSMFNGLRSQVDSFDTLMDPNEVRSDILKYLGSTIGADIDDTEPIDFRRSLVNNAVLLYQRKGSKEAYRIRGKISGFDVTVINLFKFDPVYLPYIDTDNLYEIGGVFYSELQPGSVSGIPSTPQCDYCLTAFIKIEFLTVKAIPSSDTENFFDKLIRKLREEVIPIHVRDVVYDLQVIVEIDEAQYLGLDILQEEETFIPVSAFYRFDMVPCDRVRLDAHGFVTGSTNEE